MEERKIKAATAGSKSGTPLCKRGEKDRIHTYYS
jgi:hypothetical protein